MNKLFVFFLNSLILLSHACQSQTPSYSIKSEAGFTKKDYAISVFDPVSNSYRINFQTGDNIYRALYDTSFRLLNNYSFSSTKIGFSPTSFDKARFITPLITTRGYFEIYSQEKELFIYRVDFASKKDSLVRTFAFSQKINGEKLISLMPGRDDLKILTYAEDFNSFKVYKWSPDDSLTTSVFETSGNGLTKEEEKEFTKTCQVKYKKLGQVAAAEFNTTQTLPAAAGVFYKGNRIFLLVSIPYSIGLHVMDFDIEKNTLTARNYVFNSLEINAGTVNYAMTHFVSTIRDSVLVIQNSSHYKFEYLFYNLNNGRLIKKHSVPVEDSIFKLIHSTFIQNGTYASKNQEKELKKEKSFIRKINAAFDNIITSSENKDSIVFTLSSIQYTEGVAGTLISAAISFPVDYVFGSFVGSLVNIPFLTSNRYKLFYVHSRFNKKTWEPAGVNTVITTLLDKILDSFERKELNSNSTFFIEKNNGAFIGVLNKETQSFDIYKFAD